MMFFCVYLLMLLEVLRSLEGFLANFTDVRLERGVDTEMTGDVVALCTSGTTVLPFAS